MIDIAFSLSYIQNQISGHYFDLIEYLLGTFLYHRKLYERIALYLTYSQIKLLKSIIASRKMYSNFEDVILSKVMLRRNQLINANVCVLFDGTPSKHDIVVCNHFVGLICSRLNVSALKHIKKKTLLYDFRIYTKEFLQTNFLYRDGGSYDQFINDNSLIKVDYRKKFLFSIYDQEPVKSGEYYLFYASNLWKDELSDITQRYQPCLVITDRQHVFCRSVSAPVKDMFTLFHTYVYHGTKHNFDCSNRLVKECQFFDKNIIILRESYGLKERLSDSLESLTLKNDDIFWNII